MCSLFILRTRWFLNYLLDVCEWVDLIFGINVELRWGRWHEYIYIIVNEYMCIRFLVKLFFQIETRFYCEWDFYVCGRLEDHDVHLHLEIERVIWYNTLFVAFIYDVVTCSVGLWIDNIAVCLEHVDWKHIWKTLRQMHCRVLNRSSYC